MNETGAADSPQELELSVVIPCHNEETNVEPLVRGLNAYYREYLHEIADSAVDDMSS